MSSVYARFLARDYLDRIQESPTLDLVQDCLRFVAGYFEVISASSAHIYHSALVVAPQESIVRQLYQSHARPLTRVVHGAPTSWDLNTASASCPSEIMRAEWSPCGRFIAIAWGIVPTIDVLDSMTLQRLQTFTPPQSTPALYRALVFSPDGHILTYYGTPHGYHGLCVGSWDLQTGGLVSTITLQGPGPGYSSSTPHPSIAHSASGEIVGVFHWDYGNTDTVNIFIFDIASGVYMRSHSFNNGIPFSYHIWTHGESFRFATADAATITIWEVGFTLDATPMEVETLRSPVVFVDEDTAPGVRGPFSSSLLLTRTPEDMILLACANGERILVWDIRNSKCLLDCEDTRPFGSKSFSSDGRFFVCGARQSTTFIWKESPTGYALHRILLSSDSLSNPLLSPNGESIITYQSLNIRLWRTRKITAPPSGALTKIPQYNSFVLDFSPDGTFAAFAAKDGDTVTVLNLESGVPQLTIDADTEIHGLRVIGNTVVVVGIEVISWNLPAGDCVPDARADREDSTWTVYLNGGLENQMLTGTISSDLRHVALMIHDIGFGDSTLCIYSASAGEPLYTVKARDAYMLWFTPDGSHVMCVTKDIEAELCGFNERGKLEGLEDAAGIERLLEGNPWASSRGYRVMDDRWILGPDGKRLLMLPPPWRSYPVYQVWKGKFLALLRGELSEPVILEMEP